MGEDEHNMIHQVVQEELIMNVGDTEVEHYQEVVVVALVLHLEIVAYVRSDSDVIVIVMQTLVAFLYLEEHYLSEWYLSL